MCVCVCVCVCVRERERQMSVFCQVYCAKFRIWGSGERGKGIKSKISLNGAYIQIIFRADILHGIQTKNNEMPFEIIDLFECCSLVILLVKMTSLKILNEGTQEDFCLLIWESVISAFLRSLFSFLSVYSSLSFKKWAGAPFFFAHHYFLSLSSALLVFAFIPVLRHRHVRDGAVLRATT